MSPESSSPLSPDLPSPTVAIRGLAFGGDGVGEVVTAEGEESLVGTVAFVPFTAPGDVVKVALTERKERHIRAEAVGWVDFSSERATPGCEYFTVCGGCQIQHIRYETQLSLKREMIRGAMRAGGLAADAERVKSTVPSLEYGYRRRVSLHVDERGRLGFYRAGSREVVSISHCPISARPISNALRPLAELTARYPGLVSSLTLSAAGADVHVSFRAKSGLNSSALAPIEAALRADFPLYQIVSDSGVIAASGTRAARLDIELQTERVSLEVPVGNFSQINEEVNSALVRAVIERAKPAAGARILDLYAGAGNFAVPLARSGAEVTAVECDKELVQFGHRNGKELSSPGAVRFLLSSVEKALASRELGRVRQDAVVADPPRSGLGSATKLLPPAGVLLLISCHLPSFINDLRALAARGWSVEEVIPFDMFAQTTYVEILSVLRRT